MKKQFLLGVSIAMNAIFIGYAAYTNSNKFSAYANPTAYDVEFDEVYTTEINDEGNNTYTKIVPPAPDGIFNTDSFKLNNPDKIALKTAYDNIKNYLELQKDTVVPQVRGFYMPVHRILSALNLSDSLKALVIQQTAFDELSIYIGIEKIKTGRTFKYENYKLYITPSYNQQDYFHNVLTNTPVLSNDITPYSFVYNLMTPCPVSCRQQSVLYAE